jgi:hypothetical protein
MQFPRSMRQFLLIPPGDAGGIFFVPVLSYPLFPISCSLFPVPRSLFPVPYSLFPVPYSLFPVPYSLFPSFCLLPSSAITDENGKPIGRSPSHWPLRISCPI